MADETEATAEEVKEEEKSAEAEANPEEKEE